MQTPNMRTKRKMKRYELSDYFLSLTTGEQIALLTNTGFKNGFWREPKKFSHYWMTYHFCLFNSKKERISYEFSFDVAIDLYYLISLNDFDNLEVIDDDFGQPYDYQYYLSKNPNNNFALKVQKKVNNLMQIFLNEGLIYEYQIGDYI